MYKKICIVRLSAIGDVILTVPVVRALQRCFPQAQLTWVTTSMAYNLLQGLTDVEFIVIKKPESLADYWRFWRQMSAYEFDVLLALQANMRVNFLYPLIKAQRKIGFDRFRARDGHYLFIKETIQPRHEHLLDGFLQFTQQLGCESQVPQWDLPIFAEDHAWAQQRLAASGPWLAVNAAASKVERNWLPERYAQVLEIARQRWQVNVVLTGGPTELEREMATKITAHLSFPVLNLVGQTSLKQLAAVLSRADVLLAPDTGPSHLATAMGTPVVGLFAVAPPELSGPYLSKHLIVNKYPEAVATFLQRDVNAMAWATRVHTSKAMELITVPEVVERLALVLG